MDIGILQISDPVKGVLKILTFWEVNNIKLVSIGPTCDKNILA
jgi:hypothetical protein